MAVPRPTLRQLAHLVALADALHFGRAAAACHVTQSTLSASVKELEQALQAALVDRTRRTVVFTPLGHEVVARARRLLEDTDALVRAAQADAEPLSGPLRMGVIPTIGPFLLPTILPKLRRSYPKLRLYLVEDLTQRLVEQLHEGKLDIALLALPYECGNVEERPLFKDQFQVALPRDHPLAQEESIKLRQLRAEGLLLLKEGHCLRAHAMEACSLTDPRQVEPVEATSLHTLVQMVDNGLGITLLPQLAIDAGILRGTKLAVLPLAGSDAARDIGLIWRKGTGRRAEFELLAEEIAALAGTPTTERSHAIAQNAR
jgi:LysR family hydrogen peroxide-inducible transcriptional activator